jgi:dipeptidyl aminopeptidase/acylaminoacyl peptidase
VTDVPATRYDFERFLNVRAASGPSFSPDGQRLSFLTNVTGMAEVWSVPISTSGTPPAWPEQLTFSGDRIQGVSYSPSQDLMIAGADVGGNERTQLYLLSPDGALFERLTERTDVIHQFGGWQEDGTRSNGWSTDGTRITYASNERDPRYFDVYERPLHDAPRMLLRHDGTNYSAGYSPDGRYVLVQRHESNIRNQLLLVDTQTGDVRTLAPEITEGPGSHVAARWSADRRGLYLLSDRGRQFLTLAWLDLATTDLTFLRDDPDDHWDAEGLAVSRDGRHLALATNVDGDSRLELLDVTAGWEQRRAFGTPELPRGVISGLEWSTDGTKLAFTLDCADDAPDVFVWDIAQQSLWRATRSSLGGIPQSTFVAPSVVHYPTFDGRQIPALLFTPRDIDARGLQVVVYVHGGPESQYRPNFNPVVQYLVNQGYAVLAPNVRGSTGYGYQYQSLDDVRLRMDSVNDLRHAALWLGENGLADPHRIAVMGGSYGGFMVLAALTTYPDVWAAGVDTVGIANFVTFLENTGPWRRKLREVEYGSLEHERDFLEEISPIKHVDRITAPLFVVHGANDPRVPVGEAEQIVAALQARDVPVEYLRFEDEGHGLQKRANRLIAYPRIAAFLDRYVRDRA